ncbi:MAG TPA: flavodoxin domain-containing protein [Burkholderiaceae bacterium]|nr:flavodoxin domain-containing protein [Burkholderiaceae bacterium]
MDRFSPLLYTILVGTMTGTAEIVAEEIGYALEQGGAAVTQIDMADATPAVFQRPGRFIICCSTYGSGDVPDNAQALYASLLTEKPDLSSVRYAVFGLGDHAYAATFGYGGRKFDAALESLGATRLIETFVHDASGDTLPEDDCLEWLQPLLAECSAQS